MALKEQNYPFKNIPDLTYHIKNIEHIYNRFRDMVTRGKETNEKLSQKYLAGEYPFIEQKKKELVPKNVKEYGYKSIKEHTFRMLIKLLYEQNWLDLWDNHKTFDDSTLFHSLNVFFDSPEWNKNTLIGTYNTFQHSRIFADKIIVGTLKISLSPMNSLETISEESLTSDFERGTENVFYKGTIVKEKRANLYSFIDQSYKCNRYIRLRLYSSSPETDQAFFMAGWNMYEHLGEQYIRRILIQRPLDEGTLIIPNYYDIDSDIITRNKLLHRTLMNEHDKEITKLTRASLEKDVKDSTEHKVEIAYI